MPHTRDRAGVRREMLGRAARLFAEKPFHRAHTSDLAAEGGFSEGSLFTYFGSKEGVLRALFQQFWREMYEQRANALKGVSDPAEQIRTTIRIAVSVFRANEHLFRATTTNCYPQEEEGEASLADYHAKYRKAVLRSFLRAAQAGILQHQHARPAVAAELAYHSLLGAVQQLLNQFYCQKHLEKRRPAFQIDDIEDQMWAWFKTLLRVRVEKD